MSGLFIRLYLDEDVDVLVAAMVRAHGFDALTTGEAERQLFHSGREHAGIFFAVRRLPGEIARRLLVILNALTADEMKNQVRYL